jgi:hypothetical protein
MYAPPWIRGQQRQEEAVGSYEKASRAEAHSGLEPQQPTSHSAADLQQRHDAEPQSGTRQLQTNEQGFDPEEAYEETYPTPLSPSRLEPTVMPPPPAVGARQHSLVTGVRWIGAVAVAAIVATVVTIATQAPSPEGLAVFENAGAAVRQSLASVQADVSNATAVQAKQATEVPSPPVQPDRTTSPPSGAAMAEPQPQAPQQSRSIALLEPAAATPSPMAASPMTAPRPHTASSLTREEITSMLKRGQDLIAAGDIAGARLILFRVSEAGDAEASLTLARTFDADVLAKLNIVGAVPDAAKARALYAKAAGQGSSEARRRLEESNR